MVLSKMKFTNQIEIQENEVVNNAAADEEENVSTNQLENSQINSRPALTTASLKNQLYLPLPESWVFWQPYDAKTSNSDHADLQSTTIPINDKTYELIEFNTLSEFLKARVTQSGRLLVKRKQSSPEAFDTHHGGGNWCTQVNRSQAYRIWRKIVIATCFEKLSLSEKAVSGVTMAHCENNNGMSNISVWLDPVVAEDSFVVQDIGSRLEALLHDDSVLPSYHTPIGDNSSARSSTSSTSSTSKPISITTSPRLSPWGSPTLSPTNATPSQVWSLPEAPFVQANHPTWSEICTMPAPTMTPVNMPARARRRRASTCPPSAGFIGDGAAARLSAPLVDDLFDNEPFIEQSIVSLLQSNDNIPGPVNISSSTKTMHDPNDQNDEEKFDSVEASKFSSPFNNNNNNNNNDNVWLNNQRARQLDSNWRSRRTTSSPPRSSSSNNNDNNTNNNETVVTKKRRRPGKRQRERRKAAQAAAEIRRLITMEKNGC